MHLRVMVCVSLCVFLLGHSKSITCFSSPLSPKIDLGGQHVWHVMVVKITSLVGNGRQNYKFISSKNGSGILLYCAGTNGITCGRKSRGNEKRLIDLEWLYHTSSYILGLYIQSETIYIVSCILLKV